MSNIPENCKTIFEVNDGNIKITAMENGTVKGHGFLPKPTNIVFYGEGDKVAKVTFADGTYEKAVLRDNNSERERKEAAVAICLLKKFLEPGREGQSFGTNAYNKYIELAFRAQEKVRKEKEAAELAQKKADELRIRVAAKKKAKKEREIKSLLGRLQRLLGEPIYAVPINDLSQADLGALNIGLANTVKPSNEPTEPNE